MKFVNNLDAPQFLASDVCTGTGVSPSTLKNWISRNPPIIVMQDSDREAHMAGRPLRFTLRRIVQIGITYELVRFGIDPRPAAMAARRFTDSGNKDRLPGFHFAKGETFLAQHPRLPVPRIINVNERTHFLELLRRINPHRKSTVIGGVYLNIGEVEFFIRARLKMEREVFKMPAAGK